MKRLLEFFQDDAGYYCVLQLAIGISFSIFWVIWTIIALDNHFSLHQTNLPDVPNNVWLLLGAMLAAKVTKDRLDQPSNVTAPAPTP